MSFPPSYYHDLERDVTDLADQLAGRLSDRERQWIAEWVGVGEYGLAVTVILENLGTRHSGVNPETIEEARRLALQIGLNDEVRRFLP